MQDNLLNIVINDLQYLFEKTDWTEHDLRRSSHIIRRLLVYGDLGKAWRVKYGKQPKIQSLSFNDIEENDIKNIRFAMLGNLNEISKMKIINKAMTPEEVTREFEKNQLKRHTI